MLRLMSLLALAGGPLLLAFQMDRGDRWQLIRQITQPESEPQTIDPSPFIEALRTVDLGHARVLQEQSKTALISQNRRLLEQCRSNTEQFLAAVRKAQSLAPQELPPLIDYLAAARLWAKENQAILALGRVPDGPQWDRLQVRSDALEGAWRQLVAPAHR
jgi:hypothetical protein